MPKSKRNKVVHLTQVKKKSKDHKDDLIRQLTELVEKHEFVYVFDFDKTKSDRIMNLRLKMKEYGRIFAGRNSLVAHTFRTIGEKTDTDYDKLLQHVKGHRGLLFTRIERDQMLAMLEEGHSEFRDKLLGYAHLKSSALPAADISGDEIACRQSAWVSLVSKRRRRPQHSPAIPAKSESPCRTGSDRGC